MIVLKIAFKKCEPCLTKGKPKASFSRRIAPRGAINNSGGEGEERIQKNA